MVRAIIVDDEPLALRQLRSYISRTSDRLELVGSFNSAISAREFLSSNSVDLIFCDINMPELSGIEFISSMQSEDGAAPMVIFTTAHSEYAIDGFRLDAVDYLLKPFPFADFERAAQRAYSLFMLRRGQGHDSGSEIVTDDLESADDLDGTISIKADYKTSLIKLSDIIYLESESEYVRLHLCNARPITTLVRLKNMEALLPSAHFTRIHRSYIVNLHYVKSYERGKVYLSEECDLPIGQNYREPFLQAMKSYLK